MTLVIGLIIGVLAGIGIAYFLLEKRFGQPKPTQPSQVQRLTEDLERSHQSRLQETIESIKAEHQNQLRKAKEELEKNYEIKMQELLQSAEEKHDNHLIQVTEDLQKVHETKTQEILQVIHEDYQGQVRDITQELEQKYQAQIQALTMQYEMQIRELGGVPETVVFEPEPISESTVSETVSDSVDSDAAPLTSPDVDESVISEEIAAEVPDISPEIPLEARLGSSDAVIADAVPSAVTTPVVDHTVGLGRQDVSQKILAWGNAAKTASIPQLIEYINHPDGQIRQLTATTLGTIAAANGLRSEVKKAIPVLGKLSQDPNPQVRQSAVAALGRIKSEGVIPFLQKALKDTNHAVVKTASAAMTRFKFYPLSGAAKPQGLPSAKNRNQR